MDMPGPLGPSSTGWEGSYLVLLVILALLTRQDTWERMVDQKRLVLSNHTLN